MDVLSFIGLSPVKEFDQLLDFRAEKRERLRGRNNATSCRSPTRGLDTALIKRELKKKRQQEFLRRRSVSPEPSSSKPTERPTKRNPPPVGFSTKHHSFRSKSETLHTNMQSGSTANGHLVMVLAPSSSTTDDPSTSKWASLWSEQISVMKQEKGQAKKKASTSMPVVQESSQRLMKSSHKKDNSVNVQKTSTRTFIQTEKIQQKSFEKKKMLRETGMQSESGFVTVRESDIQRLADYLQEALWREEALKKKLAALQESTTNLVNSSNKIWTSRCTEDLLRNKIKTLEAQLQVCLLKFPKDGVKKLVVQMEKQRLMYEETALVALQKTTQEKTEALSKAETLQKALVTAKAEALRWQGLYEELKLSSVQLRENQYLSNEQLQQLHSQVELSRAREDELREEVVSLRQEKQELQYNISLLEENNQTLGEEIQLLRDGSDENQDFMMLEEAEPTVRRDSQLGENLRLAQEKLQLKEKECEELRSELHAMEQECQSSQARLSQCRDELRQLSHRRRRTTPCGSWWKLLVIFLLLLAVAGVVMLWLWHPDFRDQVEDLYSDIETRIEDYLMEMASPLYSGCFRPI